jgi:hypothetical protein
MREEQASMLFHILYREPASVAPQCVGMAANIRKQAIANWWFPRKPVVPNVSTS